MGEGGTSAGPYPASALRIGAADIGRRVTVRRRVPGGYSDVIGELLSVAHSVVQLRRRDGEVVSVPTRDIVAARSVG